MNQRCNTTDETQKSSTDRSPKRSCSYDVVLKLQILVKKRIVYFSFAVKAITAALPVQRRIRGIHLEEFWSWSCVASDGVHDMDNEGKTLNS